MRRSRQILLAIPLALLLTAWTMAQETPRPRRIRSQHFFNAATCALCHSQSANAGALRDSQGRGVAPYDLWRGSMMANAAIDPFFAAVVAAEVAVEPTKVVEIEASCLRCHAPMAHEERRRLKGLPVSMQDVHAQTNFGALARDGVSCTLCHQIQPRNLGSAASFNGNWIVDEDRQIFGPHDDVYALPMANVVNYFPEKGEHMLDSALCGTCHTLAITHEAKDGEPAHVFYEQTPYLEWRNSVFAGAEKRTCQSCHVPQTDRDGAPIRARIAREVDGSDFDFLEPREPLGRHLYVGGNTLIPAILRDHAAELGATAPKEAYDATIAATREQLRHRTARITITELYKGTAEFTVVVENRTGHKFPSAHPSRRAWLRVTIRDRAGKLLFACGEFDAAGRLLGSNGKPLAGEAAGGPLYPHREVVTSADEPLVYEGPMADAEGKFTILARHARAYAKDNRLLPRGWEGTHPDAPATRPVGVGSDADYATGLGRDRVSIRPEIADEVRMYTIEVELLYQPLAPRYAAELFEFDLPAVQRFRAMYEKADRRPEVVARTRMTIVR